MRKVLFRLLFCLPAAALLVPGQASAQGAFNMGMLTNTLSQGGSTQSEGVRARTSSVFRSMARAPRSGAVNRAAITYRPSTAVRQRNMQQFVARLRRVDPTSAADLQRTFARRDVVAEVGGAMRPVGLNPNNVADAMAMYLVAAYYGVRGSVDSKPSDYKAVSAQLARAVSAAPGFASASDALKQEIAESMLVQAVLVDQAIQAAQKQPSAMPAVKAAIAKGARAAFGFDVTRMQLGPNGLS
ncbi:hypothetical protein E5A73_15605 [Sphingomonas gei]|uniref:Uncharacterized protein n=1 Tax=Sphingomonas gei TaxID=1395960 RepID=A0A4S1XBL9_9SPHN|nr:DUF6683 family protein [Sphingomonas gei]TGX52226.1 hypothetical protein E5A73_15605 [Sphingomonas gei]